MREYRWSFGVEQEKSGNSKYSPPVLSGFAYDWSSRFSWLSINCYVYKMPENQSDVIKILLLFNQQSETQKTLHLLSDRTKKSSRSAVKKLEHAKKRWHFARKITETIHRLKRKFDPLISLKTCSCGSTCFDWFSWHRMQENCEKSSQSPKQVAPFVQLTVRNTNNLTYCLYLRSWNLQKSLINWL